MRDRCLAYLPSLALGVLLASVLLPPEFLWPKPGLDWRPMGDAAQHAIAQRHFLAAPWGWPPLDVPTLPGGANLAFLDGIPIQALAMKLFAAAVPEGFHGIGLFYALAWAGQPATAVFALRGFALRGFGAGGFGVGGLGVDGSGVRGLGVRGWLPALAVGAMAVSMPAFVMRFGHAALCGQFVVLTALGLYARALQDPRWWRAAVPFQAAALLVHPYLALMSLALLAAAPLSAALRGDRWWPHALGLGASGGAMALVMALFGYLGAQGDAGFYGQFAMNLLSPVWPHRSLVLGGMVGREVDATGHGGWEGYNWLGLGLWLALAGALALQHDAARRALQRHAGLALACAGLLLLALSFRVGFGERIILDLGPAPGFLDQFRASGRFFWPVGYVLLIGAAALLATAGRRGTAVLCTCALIQLADGAPMRAALATWAGERAPWSFDAAALRPALREARAHAFFPSWPCIPREAPEQRGRLLELLFLASETPRPVNTMYLARWRGPAPACTDAATLARPPAPGELRVLLPEADPSAGSCEAAGELRLCRGH